LTCFLVVDTGIRTIQFFFSCDFSDKE
jgi:hypothetical protein